MAKTLKRKKKVKAQWLVNAPVLVMLPVDVCLQTELLSTTEKGGGPDTRTYKKSVVSTNFNMPCMTLDCSVHNYTMKRARTTKKNKNVASVSATTPAYCWNLTPGSGNIRKHV